MEEEKILIERRSLVDDLLEAYRRDDLANHRLHVEFLCEEGEDFGGLTKEMFTVFWAGVTEQLFCGEHRRVPRLPLHREKKEAWKFVSIGRILSHTVALTGAIPAMLSTSVLRSAFFQTDVAEETLLEDFLLYVTDRERVLLQKAMTSFRSLNDEELARLEHFFTAHLFFDTPRATDVVEQITSIAEEELIKRPAYLCSQIRKGIPESHRLIFWTQLSIDHIHHLQAKRRPTQQKVVSCLVTQSSDLTAMEDTTYYYLREFIGALKEDDLTKLLIFVTGSVHQPQKITVTFNSSSGVMRCPTAHTCSNILELPTTYSSFQEFRREFNLVLNSPEAFVYAMI